MFLQWPHHGARNLMKTLLDPLNSSISLSQAGFMFLQWPHQGARNLMKTVFPAVSASQLAGVSSVADAAPSTDKAATILRAMVLSKALLQKRANSKQAT